MRLLKDSSPKLLSLLVLVSAVFAISEFMYWLTTGQFGWPPVILAVVVGTGTWFSLNRHVWQILSGFLARNRRFVRWFIFWLGWVFLFTPFSVHALIVIAGVRANPLAQFTMIAVAPVFGALALAAVPRFNERQGELIHAAKMFILATVCFVIFQPLMYFIDLMEAIEPNSIDLMSADAWVRGIYFWLAAFSFFGGITLFLAGLVDLVFSLVEIGKKSKVEGTRCLS